ncbi:MAG: glycerate kinase, partial [Eggerthellaceae bacterium]|nr:glycerate kinase [Eggerthellaceae bacterium]
GEAICSGILRAIPDAEVKVIPFADGGEGTTEALVQALDGSFREIQVTGPLGTPVIARYGIVDGGKIAVIEMSQAAGISLVPKQKLNPLYTTTFGVGEMIKDAIAQGVRNFVVGIGGSATNDGGVGMLQALGYSFKDEEGEEVPFGARGLEHLANISAENVTPEIENCKFKIACDVDNVLCGKYGATAIYGPQKGATASMILDIDQWLDKYAKLVKALYPEKADPNFPGCGAAGGLGFAFLIFLNSELKPGIELIAEAMNLEDDVKDSNIIITGEGRIDAQSAMGKLPGGVAKIAKKYNKPVIAFVGSASKDACECNKLGIDAIFPILREITNLEEAMEPSNAKANLASTAEQVFRVLKIEHL